MRYLIGVDLGTSGTKTVLFDENGTVIRTAHAEYPMNQPQNGYAEQNPEDWKNAVLKTVDAVMSGGEPISAIGLSGQMHGLVMLDRNGQVIRPAILWCDQRSERQCMELTGKVGKDNIISITANPALTGFTASKILWVKEHEPQNFDRCAHILLPKDYVRYCMTGIFATDVSDASGTQLLDVPNRRWSGEMLDAIGISSDMLPKLFESTGITGFYRGIPVVAGGGDNACAAVGSGTVRSGRAFTTIGTSGVVFAHTDTPVIDPHGRVHTFCCAVPGKWHVMGVTQAAGLSLKWFRENFAPTCSYGEIDRLAASVPIGADGVRYLPYLMGERTPYLDPSVRGAFLGLSGFHKKEHLMRAVLEGVSYSLKDCLSVFNEMQIYPDSMALVGGGAKSDFWKQMLADVFGMNLSVPDVSEGAALGAAILGGVGVGLYDSVEAACDHMIGNKATCYANPYAVQEYSGEYEIYRTLYDRVKNIGKR